MRFNFDAPGLKIRANRDGTTRLYWCARADLVKAGYRPQSVRLSYTLDDPHHRTLITAACRKYQVEMLDWVADAHKIRRTYDGTLTSLSRFYQADEASPFNRLKHTTRRKDLYTLRIIEGAFGGRALVKLRISDFYRWYDAAKKPKTPDGEERIRRACGIIKKLRELFAYGVMAELPECKRLYEILQRARFPQPPRRRVAMELVHVRAFVAKALEIDRLSLALGTAIQFETALRQRDVIGEWEPTTGREKGSYIILNGRRWMNGLQWSDLSPDLVIRKATTKTGAFAAHDLKLCPIVLSILDRVPIESRDGPLIIDEVAGRPFAESAYGREWRIVARAAGVPDHVWNMDARAGAITEAENAGADLDLIRSAATHAQMSTTLRYSRGAIEKSRRVAELRRAYRDAAGRT